MNDIDELPLILLGAGASVPAEIPSALEMTKRLTEICSSEGRLDLLRPLTAITGALMMSERHENGPNIKGVDIERVMNAIVLLADRHKLEFMPFVAAWHPIVDELERRPFSSFDASRIARSAVSGLANSSRFFNQNNASRFANDIERSVETILQRALKGLSRRLSEQPAGIQFRALADYLTAKLVDLMWLTSNEKLTYLEPLVQIGRNKKIVVATLNYDTSIEQTAKKLGIVCDRGIEAWIRNEPWAGAPVGIELLKLHGSVDWIWSESRTGSAGFMPRMLVVGTDEERQNFNTYSAEHVGGQIGVVFGGQNKLTAEGPFLDLIGEFKSELNKRKKLVAIGYSFRDEHINQIIFRWLEPENGRSLRVIEAPGQEMQQLAIGTATEFRSQIEFSPIGVERYLLELANQ